MKNFKFIDRLRCAFKDRNEAEHEKALEEAVQSSEEADETAEEKKKREAKEAKEAENAKTGDTLTKVLDSLKSIGTRLAALETRDAKRVKDEAEEETAEEKKKREAKEAKEAEDAKTSDAAFLAAETRDTIARVEILSPGLHLPTFDTAAPVTQTRDALCALKVKALTAAFEGKHRDAIVPFVGKTKDFTKLTCDQVNGAFIGASEIVRRENNAGSKGTFDGAKTANGVASQISAINKRNTEYWSGRNN